MTRSLGLGLLLAGTLAGVGVACKSSTPRDMWFGTDAGAGFEAPVREVHPGDVRDDVSTTGEAGTTGTAGTTGSGGSGAGGTAGTTGAAGTTGTGGDGSDGAAGATP
jgi:hypothetical protein